MRHYALFGGIRRGGSRESAPAPDRARPAGLILPPASYKSETLMSGLSYQQSGVDYDQLDGFKRLCQRAAEASLLRFLQVREIRYKGT